MQGSEETVYRERCSFQLKLDETFPRGAMCAVLEEVDGRLAAAYLLASTGRLFCSDARETGTGGWEYQILIDPRRSDRSDEEAIRLWITSVVPRTSVAGLFEAEVVTEPGDPPKLLRLNANPPAHVRPTSRMRSTVSRAHEVALFPHGIEAASPASMSSE